MRRRTWRLAVAVIAFAGAIAIWLLETRTFPYLSVNHDEGVYLQQAAMLLDGQLFVRPPVEDVFRPWFFVEDGDRLYPKYAPVPAAMFALGELVGGYRLALPGVGAAILALVALVVREVFDRRTGFAAAVIVLCSPLFLIEAAVFLPYAPTAMLNLTFAFSYLRADRTDDRRWAGVAGVAIGLAFFSRPYTAVLFAAPFVVHACWTLWRDLRGALSRQIATATLGVAGVGLALAYNATVTGSPLVFPYEAFAPLDGLGFGRRQLLGPGTEYTVRLALRSNALVLTEFVTGWIAGGIFGAVVAAIGFGVAVRRGLSPRAGILAGQILTISVGNVYFWGNYNLLGDLDRAGDGLIATHGPYYHFDLLLPFAAFAAVGALALVAVARRTATRNLTPRAARVTFVAALLVSALALGGATAVNVDQKIDRNAAVTDTYERVYEPFEDGPTERSIVFLPTPYGDWLAHPFQALRNDPDFDGRTVYAMDERPFAVFDEYSDRSLYRLAYRGTWAPHDGSPRTARLQPVEHTAGSAVELNASVGVPSAAESVTVTVTTAEGSSTHVLENTATETTVRLTATDGAVQLHGTGIETAEPVRIADRDDVVLDVFADRGPGSSFSYRLEVPIRTDGETVRALTPRVERCSGIRDCGGEAAYIPEQSPDGVFIRTELAAVEE
ncbi:ArnT family glycosyltransferase [Natrinema halophilum]|uniref:Glycosyltransferase family 39 protein n=1 Tax=Natrinema halophilum TaxID=1699371 RepID=A0A7D5KXI7_9EURY|nr:glycosyltransferase family 39 protein [Natrinema halophilum]QLG49122.1 glycosyltransferase family 39 protein [Natrinema halophilum]